MTSTDVSPAAVAAKSKVIDELTTASAEIARLRQQIAWFQAEAAKPPFRVEADFSPPLQETTK
jgi:7-keto-8-aminopelargonate synthetase-like enzyme